MRFVLSTLSQQTVDCSKPAHLLNTCRILLRNCGKKEICNCEPLHRDVRRSGGIGPRVINLWHDMGVCVVLRAQAPVPHSESALPAPVGYVMTVRAGMNSVEKSLLTLPIIEPRFLSRSASGLVTMRTEPCVSVTERRKTKLICALLG